mmetsp:Transcript_23158/g.57133  ORF Transcript_23158/g.57133 Transcript_23158/m.57133 type:complete len:120 (-) Transcript_23158:3369-3728(-)
METDEQSEVEELEMEDKVALLFNTIGQARPILSSKKEPLFGNNLFLDWERDPDIPSTDWIFCDRYDSKFPPMPDEDSWESVFHSFFSKRVNIVGRKRRRRCAMLLIDRCKTNSPRNNKS